jgi:hypothetical protein
MTWQQIGLTVDGNIKQYQMSSTLALANYPTNCGAGSLAEIIDEVTHKVVGYKSFDGTNWNTMGG